MKIYINLNECSGILIEMVCHLNYRWLRRSHRSDQSLPTATVNLQSDLIYSFIVKSIMEKFHLYRLMSRNTFWWWQPRPFSATSSVDLASIYGKKNRDLLFILKLVIQICKEKSRSVFLMAFFLLFIILLDKKLRFFITSGSILLISRDEFAFSHRQFAVF